MLSFSEYNNIVTRMLRIQNYLFLIIYFIITSNMAKKDILEEVFGESHELEAVLKQIKKQYGDGSVMMLGESPTMDIEAIPSGSLSLDCALGIGGYPKGRIVEIYGPESSGKTTLAIHAVAEAQKLGLLAAYIDAEHAFDREYAANLGVNVNKFLAY